MNSKVDITELYQWIPLERVADLLGFAEHCLKTTDIRCVTVSHGLTIRCFVTVSHGLTMRCFVTVSHGLTMRCSGCDFVCSTVTMACLL